MTDRIEEPDNSNIIEIPAPASKSLSHRYMIGAALAEGESLLYNCLESEDLKVTRDILCAAGARMQSMVNPNFPAEKGWRIWGMNGKPRGGKDAPLACDVGESGTSCRLLTAVLAAGEGLFRIYGQGRMHDRPIGELCSILASLGADIVYEEKAGYPPFLLKANRLDPELVDGQIKIGMDKSSQFFSGLLLAAPMAKTPLTIELAGQKPISWPYVGLTLNCMSDFKIRFSVEQRPRLGVPWNVLQKSTWRGLSEARPGCLRVRVWPSLYQAGEYNVEGDWSGASYFLAAGALGSRPVRVTGLKSSSLQGDRAILDILGKMGARIETGDNFVTVFPSNLHGASLDMGYCPDLVPTVAVLASFAKGSTRISNVGHLRLKESDRIAAPALELGKTGVIIDPLSDGLLINGMGGMTGHTLKHASAPKLPADCGLCAHNDHRMAMSLALLEMKDPELRVRMRLDNPAVVAKSFPNFWELWSFLQ